MIHNDLTEAATFIRVVETGSFSAAARALDVPKSTVSRRVVRLEDRLGTQLLHRTTRKMRLTPAGEVFHSIAADGLKSFVEAMTAVSEQAGEPSGTLRITGPPDLGDFIAEHIAAFNAVYPRVFVAVELSTRTVDLVGEGYDAAFRAGTLPDSGLIGRRIAASSSVMVATPAYLDEHGRPDVPSDLARHQCVLFRCPRGHARWRLSKDGRDVVVDVTGSTSGEGMSYVLAAALAGQGIAMLPSFLTRARIATGLLEPILSGWEHGGSGSLYLVYPPSRHLPAHLRAFSDFTLEHLPARLSG
jgi:DNA-binding transcriptional LysR family regulator